MRGTRARTQIRARSARPARSLRSLANTPARLRSQAPPAQCAVNKSVVTRAHSGALLLPPRSRQAAPLRPQINLQAPLRSLPSALIGCRPAIGRLHIVYRLARCVARSLRSLAITRSSRSSQAPRGHRVVSSLPLLDHRHYGDGLLRAAAWLITDAGLPAARVGRVVAVGAPPPAGCGQMSAAACPLTRACPRSCALDGRCPRSARANTSPDGLRPQSLAAVDMIGAHSGLPLQPACHNCAAGLTPCA